MQTFRKTQINTYLLLTLACMLIPPISRAQDVVALPSAKAGVPYEYTFRSEGGLPPLQWRVVSGALPEGLELGSTGTLKGTATTARQQAFEFSVEVKDAEQPAQTYVHRFKIAVAPSQLRIRPANPQAQTLPEYRAGVLDDTFIAGAGSDSCFVHRRARTSLARTTPNCDSSGSRGRVARQD